MDASVLCCVFLIHRATFSWLMVHITHSCAHTETHTAFTQAHIYYYRYIVLNNDNTQRDHTALLSENVDVVTISTKLHSSHTRKHITTQLRQCDVRLLLVLLLLVLLLQVGRVYGGEGEGGLSDWGQGNVDQQAHTETRTHDLSPKHISASNRDFVYAHMNV